MKEGTGKYILKRAMSTRLPFDILTRRTMGFGVPLGAGFRGELRDMTHDLLLDPRKRQRGIFRPSWVEGPRVHQALSDVAPAALEQHAPVPSWTAHQSE